MNQKVNTLANAVLSRSRSLSISVLSPLVLALSVAACGGGGGGGDTSAPASGGLQNSSGGNPAPGATQGGSGTPNDSATGTGAGSGGNNSGSDTAGFAVSSVQAPADYSALSAPVRLEVRGSGLQNVELLPADGYLPRLGTFSISTDRTLAWLDFDSSTLPNGTLLARIVAFNAPPGAAGQEVVAMAPRTWQLRNDPQPPLGGPIPRAGFMPEVWLTLQDLPWVDPAPLQEMMARDDAAYQQLMTNEPDRVRQTLLTYIPAHVVLFPAPHGFTGPWYACLQQPAPSACREAMNLTIGLMNGKAR